MVIFFLTVCSLSSSFPSLVSGIVVALSNLILQNRLTLTDTRYQRIVNGYSNQFSFSKVTGNLPYYSRVKINMSKSVSPFRLSAVSIYNLRSFFPLLVVSFWTSQLFTFLSWITYTLPTSMISLPLLIIWYMHMYLVNVYNPLLG